MIFTSFSFRAIPLFTRGIQFNGLVLVVIGLAALTGPEWYWLLSRAISPGKTGARLA